MILPNKITPQAAATEAIKRIRAKESLLDYAKYIDIPGKPAGDEDDSWIFEPVESNLAAHHVLMLSVLEKIIKREIPRGIFLLPPGSAKSTFCSVVAPTWAMGRKPNTKIILTSHGGELAKKHGRKARQICKSKKYRAVFECSLSKETSAADFWSIENNSFYEDSSISQSSEYMSGGILSGITGNRADGLILDDPVKGRQDADSEAVQTSTWNAYQEDLRTRLVPGGWELIVQTRWSENDISGRILPEDYDGENGLIRCRDGRDWYVVCLPAQCERDDDPLGRQIGEYLWPEWFTAEHFEGFKSQARTWSALFQQRPQPPQGTFYQRDWFKRYKIGTQPAHLNHYITSDHAPGGEDKNDFNCVRVWGIDPEGDIWMRGGFSAKEKIDKFIDKVLPLITQFKPFCWFPEDDNNWKAVSGFVEREMLSKKVFCRIEPVSPHGHDKPTKAQAFQAMASCGRVHFPEGPDGDASIDQHIRFPTGANDDEVDCSSIIGRVINEAHPAIVKANKEEPRTTAQEDFDLVQGIKRGRAKNKDDF